MKIRFLGTSHGVPMPDRHCQSIMIETDNGDYLVDAGAPVMNLLIKEEYDFARLKAVFVTHVHQDHMVGLLDMVGLATWYYKEMRFGVYMSEARGIDAVRGFCSILHEEVTERISFNVIDAGGFYDDGNLQVTAVHTDHMESTTNVSYSFAVEAEGKRVYITGDMHSTLKDFPSMDSLDVCDLFITECAHFPADKLIMKLNEINVNKVAVVHVFPTKKYDVLLQHRGEINFEMLFPKDGDVILL